MHASSEYKISALLKGGAESAQRLIESLRPLRSSLAPAALRSHWEQLLDNPAVARWVEPHASLSEKASLQVAVGVAFASMAMSIALGTHFDGVLDVHARTPNAGVVGLLFDLGLCWMLTAGVLWGAALIADRSIDDMSDERSEPRPSLREFVVAVGIARVPSLMIALILAVLPRPDTLFESALRGALVLPFFVWFAALLYNGFKYISGLTGQAALVPFLAALVIAEAIAKALIGTM